MAASKGRTLRVKACATSGGSYNTIVGIESASLSRDGVTVDISTLEDADAARLLTQADAKISMSGNYEADATGQALVRASIDSDADLFIQFLPTGTTGWRAQYKCTKYEITGDAPGKLAVSIECERTGGFTAVP
jgi:predicted secreted protein